MTGPQNLLIDVLFLKILVSGHVGTLIDKISLVHVQMVLCSAPEYPTTLHFVLVPLVEEI